ncbi:MAG: TMEM165/GDT1 family protein [Caulobacteraceae bacterium]|nr:TMEM165/GDT1 family protein [Caulobacteraceae bacterium]
MQPQGRESRERGGCSGQAAAWTSRGLADEFLVSFEAEWGDLTQLATAALVAQTGHPLSVGIGAAADCGP